MRIREKARFLALATGLALAGSCNSGPLAPGTFVVTTETAEIAGHWRGLFEVRSCSGDRCFGDERGMRDFTLTLAPAGNGVTGVLTLADHLDLPIVVNVQAGPEVDGAYAFDVTPLVLPGHDADVDTIAVHDLRLVVDPAVGLVGGFSYTETNRSGEHTDVTRRTAAVRSAVVQPGPSVSPGNFHGRWRGLFVARSCAGVCEYDDGRGLDYDRSGSIEFVLVQTGSSVTGLAHYQPITGTATATTLVAEGAPLSPEPCVDCFDCDTFCGATVRHVSLTIDKIGSLRGTLEYARKGLWRGEQITQTVQLELSGVTRVQ